MNLRTEIRRVLIERDGFLKIKYNSIDIVL